VGAGWRSQIRWATPRQRPDRVPAWDNRHDLASPSLVAPGQTPVVRDEETVAERLPIATDGPGRSPAILRGDETQEARGKPVSADRDTARHGWTGRGERLPRPASIGRAAQHEDTPVAGCDACRAQDPAMPRIDKREVEDARQRGRGERHGR